MKIKDLVLNYFGLSEESKKRFSEAFDNPFIDETYKKFLDNNYRLRIPLNRECYEEMDRGWKTLKNVLPKLVEEYNISYSDFFNNKKDLNKNSFRIIKLIRTYFEPPIPQEKIMSFLDRMGLFVSDKFSEYIDHCFSNDENPDSEASLEKAINLFIDRINELRFTRARKMELVFSLNRDDWFLSATQESWRTCLSLESPSFASYWASLAGAVIDKNIGLIYITNGEKKSYKNNAMDKVLSRSWVLLDEENVTNLVKFYPTPVLEERSIKKLLPFPLKQIDPSFVGKYRVHPLFFRNGYSNYIYQDKTKPKDYRDNSFKIVWGGKGVFTFFGNEMFEGPIFDFKGGLTEIIRQNAVIKTDIVDYFRGPRECYNCGKLISFGRDCYVKNEDEVYCLECGD